ncbi:HAD family hydrolase [Desulfohalovibrio reitneri]|uniref:HAD family hydrolase n=1 Tax=Desulfohalovibrio reitneri TaxID=1307759 RepID=UPI00054D371F|nr:HAD family phosphatase [Desulfohalovibrio reitneri]
MDNPHSIRCLFFDFGGVVAEEGFVAGLHAIAADQGLDPDRFFNDVRDVIFQNGYVTGHCSEMDFWSDLRGQLGVKGSGKDLRREILSRFRLRPHMLHLARLLREEGLKVAILSDQTNWLDELQAELGFAMYFDSVFNSYHYGYHKGQPEFFKIALRDMDAKADESLLVDDAGVNVRTARESGLHAIQYEDLHQFTRDFETYFPGLLERAHEESEGDDA